MALLVHRSGPSSRQLFKFCLLRVSSTVTGKGKHVNAIPAKTTPSKDEVVVMETNLKTLYTAAPLEPKSEITKYSSLAHKIFQSETAYVSPAEFDFALPNGDVPEFAFIGRSNVGKSSLISSLLNNKTFVRVSKSPGCTQQINFYTFLKPSNDSKKGLNDHRLYLVDLPGYGYAKVSKSDRANWKDIINSFILNRHPSILRRVFILVDSRHGIKTPDIEMMRILNEKGVPYQIILTKVDAASESEKKLALLSVFERMMKKGGANTSVPFVHALSSRTGEGLDVLRLGIAEMDCHAWADGAAREGNPELAAEISKLIPDDLLNKISNAKSREQLDVVIKSVNNSYEESKKRITRPDL